MTDKTYSFGSLPPPDDRLPEDRASPDGPLDESAAIRSAAMDSSVNSILGDTIDSSAADLDGADDPSLPLPSMPSDSPVLADQDIHRYTFDQEIARGGMGAVIRARDRTLGRELAVKVLLKESQERPELVARFIEEAQVGGQLQHPGIAPVFELGKFTDGRAFFSMKLVKGETLASILASRSGPQENVPKLIGIFEQICQTMAYAHSRGVIHRDLKPANVMVGAFGEVQVMDWGLAKVLAEQEQPDSTDQDDAPKAKAEPQSIIQTMRNTGEDTPIDFMSGGSDTMMGSVMGTPSYMPPEQALGEIDRVDRRSDVFGLGAILCEILTGKPPYIAAKPVDIYRLATRCQLDECHQRLDRCEAESELIAIARHCLQPESDKRPIDAGVLAGKVSNYLVSVQTRLHAAEMEQAAEHGRLLEERKRRRVTMALASLLTLFVIAAGGAAIVIQQNRAEIADANLRRQLLEVKKDRQLAKKFDQTKQSIRSELSLGKTLLAEAIDGELPQEYQVRRVIESTERARYLITHEIDSDPIAAEAKDFQVQAIALSDAFDLARTLEETATEELLRSSEDQKLTVHSTDHPNRTHVSHGGTVQQITKAFQKWGLDSNTSPNDAKLQFEQLPSWAKPIVMDAMQNLRFLSGQESSRLERSLSADWYIPTLRSATSLKGASLKLLKDQSILAEGNNPATDEYVIEYETDIPEFNAIRLEALTHPSLPKRGPGRDKDGTAAICGTEVWVRRTDNSNGWEKILLGHSDATNSFYPLTTTGWTLATAQGRSHTKVLYLNQPRRSETTSQIRIVLRFNPTQHWSGQNLGRFRVSLSKCDVAQPDPTQEHWITRVINHCSPTDFNTELWTSLEGEDTTRLITLAEQADSLDPAAPDIIRLALALHRFGSRNQAGNLDQNILWNVFDFESIRSEFPIRQLADGTLLASDKEQARDVYRLHHRMGGDAITAVRLETLRDDSIPNRGPGLNGDGTSCLISDFYIEADDAKQKEPFRFDRVWSEAIPIDNYFANYSIDGDHSKLWAIKHPATQDRCVSIFRIENPSVLSNAQDVTLNLETGSNYRAVLAKFRLAWTDVPMASTVDPQRLAIDLIGDAYTRRSSNYCLLLANARFNLMGAAGNREVAAGLAASALSLRPNDPQGLQFFSDVILSRAPLPTDPWFELLLRLAEQVSEPTKSQIKKDAFDQQLRLGKSERLKDSQIAINAYESAMRILPEASEAWGELSDLYRLSNQHQKAEEMISKAIAKRPDDEWCWLHLAKLRLEQKRYVEAGKLFLKSVKIQENKHNRPKLAICLLAIQNYGDAEGHLEHTKDLSKPAIQESLLHAARCKLQLGKFDEAIALLRRLATESNASVPIVTELCLALASSVSTRDEYLEATLNRLRQHDQEFTWKIAAEIRNSFTKTDLFRVPKMHDLSAKLGLTKTLSQISPYSAECGFVYALAALCHEDWSGLSQAVQNIRKCDEIKPEVGKILESIALWKLGKIPRPKVAIELALDPVFDPATANIATSRPRQLDVQKMLVGLLVADNDRARYRDAAALMSSPAMIALDDHYSHQIFGALLLQCDDKLRLQLREEYLQADAESKLTTRDRLRLAWIQSITGGHEEAITTLSKWVRNWDDSYLDRLFLAKAYLASGDTDSASEQAYWARRRLDLHWHPELPNEDVPPTTQSAFIRADEHIRQLEKELPQYRLPRPELKYLTEPKRKPKVLSH